VIAIRIIVFMVEALEQPLCQPCLVPVTCRIRRPHPADTLSQPRCHGRPASGAGEPSFSHPSRFSQASIRCVSSSEAPPLLKDCRPSSPYLHASRLRLRQAYEPASSL